MKRLRPFVACVSLLLLAPLAAAQRPGLQASASDEAVQREFPLRAVAMEGELGLRLALDRERLASVRDEAKVLFRGVAVPTPAGFEDVDLELTRVRVVSSDADWFVNGKRVGGRAELEAATSFWSGRVVGEAGSDVFLAFTNTGTWGWVDRTGSGMAHVIARPQDGDWSYADSLFLHESDERVGAMPRYTCEALDAPGRAGGGEGAVHDVDPQGPGPIAVGSVSRECKVAVETDFQFYQKFNDVDAATNYALGIFAAASCRYILACTTFLTVPYVAVYDNALDPWLSQDAGGNAGALLQEFRLSWGGQAFPGNAHLANFLSGANLGGGVAYVDTLCDNNFGFAVSGNLHGNTVLPIQNMHQLNWDFYVATHEAGHNFGTGHTHDYCPPIDECAPSGFFGQCQTQQQCQNGTIMSYCHLCTGGVTRIATRFHDRVSTLLQSRVQSSCLPTYAGASFVSRNGAGVNPVIYTAQTDPILGQDWLVNVDIAAVGANTSFVAVGYQGTAAAIVPRGQLLIRLPPLRPLNSGSGGDHVFSIRKDVSLLGLTFWTQAATFAPGQIRLTNAIDITLGF